MKIVIDIPEEMWERIKDGYVPLGISKYLKNGTPLKNITNEINNLASSPNANSAIDNGITLCEKCHRKVHRKKDSEEWQREGCLQNQ